MIEVLRQTDGKLMVSVGPHCRVVDDITEELFDDLAECSGVSRTKIMVAVVRATMETA